MDKPTQSQQTQNTIINQKKEELEDSIAPKNKINLNLNASEYVPKKRLQTNNTLEEKPIQDPAEKLKLNLDAKAYEPKSQSFLPKEQNQEDEDDYDFDDEEVYHKEVEVIVKDMIENEEIEDDESDEDKWFPKYKDCECCQGFVYKCNGATCQNMMSCYCKVKAECDDYY
jgi:hypothetical protein